MPSIKFLRETNGALCDIWNREDGLTEATKNIGTETIKKIVMDMRKAIDANDSKSENKLRELAKKEMVKIVKPIMSEFNKAFNKFVKDQAADLSNKYGMDVDFWQDGKPSLAFGSSNSMLDAKAGFGGHLIVGPSFEENNMDEANDASSMDKYNDEKAKYKSDRATDKDGPEVEALWIEDAINELQKEIDHKIWFMNQVKSRVQGPYGSVYSSAYKKNMREDFARFKDQIKAWKSEIKELTKKKKDLEKNFK